jgi:hypothetical protein
MIVMSSDVIDLTWLWSTRRAEVASVEMWRSCHVRFSVVVEKER